MSHRDTYRAVPVSASLSWIGRNDGRPRQVVAATAPDDAESSPPELFELLTQMFVDLPQWCDFLHAYRG
jgi:hypothetical protein